MVCKHCGCSDLNACVEPETGTTCRWVLPNVCSFCAEVDETADLVLRARFAHECASLIRQDYDANDHEGALALYDLACRGLLPAFGAEATR